MSMNNNDVKRAMELMNTIMPMMEELSELMNSNSDEWMYEEDLDSYENLTDEELTEKTKYTLKTLKLNI